MSNNELTRESPYLKRLSTYLNQRFPLVSHLSMVFIYFLANQFLAQVLGNPDEKLIIGWFTPVGMLFLLCIFFHLRVFDEHKDYKDDVKNYPDRVLSKGVINLTDLKILGGIAIFIELICAAYSGTSAIIAVSIAIFFSWIMLHEFFISKWLRAHFILYAIGHMLIMPLLTATIFSFTMNRPFWEAPWLFWAYALADFFAFSNWEISRKIKMPEDEIKGVDTYSKHLGINRSANTVIVLRVLNTILAWIVGVYLNLGIFYYGGLIILFIITLFGMLRFRFKPNKKTAAQLEHYGGGYIILFYFILAAELFHQNGMTFGGIQ